MGIGEVDVSQEDKLGGAAGGRGHTRGGAAVKAEAFQLGEGLTQFVYRGENPGRHQAPALLGEAEIFHRAREDQVGGDGGRFAAAGPSQVPGPE